MAAPPVLRAALAVLCAAACAALLILCGMRAGGSAPAPPGVVPPRDAARWLVELPVDPNGDGRADRWPLPALLAAGLPPRFTAADGGIRLRAPVDGARSRTSRFVRCELRESAPLPGRAAGAARESQPRSTRAPDWPCVTSSRAMRVELAVLAVPTNSPRVIVIVAQLHDLESDLVHAQYRGRGGGVGRGRVELAVNNGRQRTSLDDDYALGDTLRLELELDRGDLRVGYLNTRTGRGANRTRRFRIDPGLVVGGCFFKTGCYVQAYSYNRTYGGIRVPALVDDPEAFAEVLLKRVRLGGLR
ncbi:concanavalin A-like lectin/glucanase domain-containing protein [Hyaloraphidium curvatum]|nr:concanavalin A-like lectin/glucanase domain-containing protein [Hyaloraphidium curvatum]